MIDIGIYVIGDAAEKTNKHKLLFNSINYIDVESFSNSPNYRLSKYNIEISDIPESCDHDLVMLINKDTYLAQDFFEKCYSMYTMVPNLGMLCGPVFVDGKSLNKYYEYNLNFQSTIISDITQEDHNYPSINGCVISKDAYNYFCYAPTKSSRHFSLDNKSFIYSLARKYNIYYCSQLKKLSIFKECDILKLSNDYYDLGYQDGSLLRYKTKDEQHISLWHRFVESPESMDREMPRWFFNKDIHNDAELLENTVLIKCKYQIGFLEGMMNKPLL